MLEDVESLITLSGNSADAFQDRQPNLRANIIGLVGQQSQRERFHDLIPGGIECQCFTTPDTFAEAISRSVAVIVLSLDFDESVYRGLIQQTLSTSSHIQIALLATENHRATEPIPNDEVFTPPFDPESVKRDVARLYIRAYYSSTLEAFYGLNIEATTYRMQLEHGAGGDPEQLERLETAANVLESHLKQFRDHLTTEDVRELSARDEGIREFLQTPSARFDPAALGLPSACPECGLNWTENDGSQFGDGFERIAANTWRCTRCSHVISNPGSSNQYVT